MSTVVAVPGLGGNSYVAEMAARVLLGRVAVVVVVVVVVVVLAGIANVDNLVC